jgi:hypothetical protein
LGIILYNTVENIKHNIITIEKPAKMPKLNIMPFLNPTFVALFIDIILLGPGVNATIKIYEKNDTHGNIILSL